MAEGTTTDRDRKLLGHDMRYATRSIHLTRDGGYRATFILSGGGFEENVGIPYRDRSEFWREAQILLEGDFDSVATILNRELAIKKRGMINLAPKMCDPEKLPPDWDEWSGKWLSGEERTLETAAKYAEQWHIPRAPGWIEDGPGLGIVRTIRTPSQNAFDRAHQAASFASVKSCPNGSPRNQEEGEFTYLRNDAREKKIDVGEILSRARLDEQADELTC